MITLPHAPVSADLKRGHPRSSFDVPNSPRSASPVSLNLMSKAGLLRIIGSNSSTCRVNSSLSGKIHRFDHQIDEFPLQFAEFWLKSKIAT